MAGVLAIEAGDNQTPVTTAALGARCHASHVRPATLPNEQLYAVSGDRERGQTDRGPANAGRGHFDLDTQGVRTNFTSKDWTNGHHGR